MMLLLSNYEIKPRELKVTNRKNSQYPYIETLSLTYSIEKFLFSYFVP